jgi:hypothetical protein
MIPSKVGAGKPESAPQQPLDVEDVIVHLDPDAPGSRNSYDGGAFGESDFSLMGMMSARPRPWGGLKERPAPGSSASTACGGGASGIVPVQTFNLPTSTDKQVKRSIKQQKDFNENKALLTSQLGGQGSSQLQSALEGTPEPDAAASYASSHSLCRQAEDRLKSASSTSASCGEGGMGSPPMLTSAPARPIDRFLNADLARHFPIELLIGVFKEFDFDWHKAKVATRANKTITEEMKAVLIFLKDQGIDVFCDYDIGTIKMWLINGLRNWYAWRPFQMSICEQYGLYVLVDRLASELQLLRTDREAIFNAFKEGKAIEMNGRSISLTCTAEEDSSMCLYYRFDDDEALCGSVTVDRIDDKKFSIKTKFKDEDDIEQDIIFNYSGSDNSDSDIDAPVHIYPDQNQLSHILKLSKNIVIKICASFKERDPAFNHASLDIPFDINLYDPGPGVFSPGPISGSHALSTNGLYRQIMMQTAGCLFRAAEQGWNFPLLIAEVEEAIAPFSLSHKAKKFALNEINVSVSYAVFRDMTILQNYAEALLKYYEGIDRSDAPISKEELQCIREMKYLYTESKAITSSLNEDVFFLKKEQRIPLDETTFLRCSHVLVELNKSIGLFESLQIQTAKGLVVAAEVRREMVLGAVCRKEKFSRDRLTFIESLLEGYKSAKISGRTPSTSGVRALDYETLRTRIDTFMTPVIREQLEIDRLQKDAYHSSLAVTCTVGGLQIAQKTGRGIMVSDIAFGFSVLSDAGFAWEYSVAQFDDASITDKTIIAGDYLLAVAKYVDRCVSHLEKMDQTTFARTQSLNVFGRIIAVETIVNFVAHLALAKKERNPGRAWIAAKNFFNLAEGTDPREVEPCIKRFVQDLSKHALVRIAIATAQRFDERDSRKKVLEQINSIKDSLDDDGSVSPTKMRALLSARQRESSLPSPAPEPR